MRREARVDRPAYTVCVVERLHEALRRHDVFVDPSKRWGDSRAKLLQREQWEGIRAQICQTLGREMVAPRALTQLGEQLEEAYQRVVAHLPTNTALEIEQQNGEDVPNLERLERLEEPESLHILRESVGTRLPLVVCQKSSWRWHSKRASCPSLRISVIAMPTWKIYRSHSVPCCWRRRAILA